MRETFNKIRSPLKWAGGKFRVLEQIKKRLPDGSRLIEPFAGSSVVFLNTDFKHYTLSDSNHDLIRFYKLLKKDGAGFIDYCRKYFGPKYNNATEYYKIRDKFNSTNDTILKSALFLYINKHGYNGLCRYNASGKLNVPFGRYKKPYFPENELLLFSKKSKKATIKCEDFEKIINKATPEDVIYCDPPYVPRNRTSYFTSYSAVGFNEDEQIRLANAVKKAADSGVSVLVSNHSNNITKNIYSEATHKYHFNVRRVISCNGNKRELARELLALYLPSNK
ncbi:MAG: Dam family site-specific DNA-(adenine-N6)-methyltransferase [Proteobacteria bacterium]|nr:Dam family site-specific DNA-(adenine-N6)-methyltransferase [Pseudomonadota bacterium]